MTWEILFDDDFRTEFDAFAEEVQDVILARVLLLAREGPALGRPHVDTLSGSRHANMKELRCTVDRGVWRVAFAFDPRREAILLAAGNKAGISQKRFYRQLITTADKRFDRHLAAQKGG